jgi:hypothetical protein
MTPIRANGRTPVVQSPRRSQTVQERAPDLEGATQPTSDYGHSHEDPAGTATIVRGAHHAHLVRGRQYRERQRRETTDSPCFAPFCKNTGLEFLLFASDHVYFKISDRGSMICAFARHNEVCVIVSNSEMKC